MLQIEQSIAKGSALPLETYDVEDAIKVVRELAEGVVEATAHAKHHFRSEWVDQLIARYRDRPGKPVIHLSDLPDQVIPTMSDNVRSILEPYWNKLVAERGSEWGAKRFRCIWDIMKFHTASRWSSLRSWRAFSDLTGLNVDDLEMFTTALRPAGTGTSRTIRGPRLPFSLATVEGAKLFGYGGDAVHDTSALVNKERILHEDYKRAILATIGEVAFTTTSTHEGTVDRTNVGVFMTLVKSLGGFDNSRRQKVARNPIPSWFFLVDEPVAKSCQRSLWDAEGSPTRDALKLGQSVDNPAMARIEFPTSRKRIKASYFRKDIQGLLSQLPPLLLVSASLLLFKLGITPYLVPLGIEKTNSGMSGVWTLVIYRTRNMRIFETKIGFLSPNKMKKLAFLNSLHESRRPRLL